MLNVTLVPNREFLTAQAASQKMFVMLKLQPNLEISQTHPATNFVFLIDTSGSMCEVVLGETTPTGKIYEMDGQTYQQVTGGKSKIDVVIESLIALINSNKLTENDRIENIATKTLGNPNLWWQIMDINPDVLDPFTLKPGLQLRIPRE
jgi:Ca-activated chloride channel family protein